MFLRPKDAYTWRPNKSMFQKVDVAKTLFFIIIVSIIILKDGPPGQISRRLDALPRGLEFWSNKYVEEVPCLFVPYHHRQPPRLNPTVSPPKAKCFIRVSDPLRDSSQHGFWVGVAVDHQLSKRRCTTEELNWEKKDVGSRGLRLIRRPPSKQLKGRILQRRLLSDSWGQDFAEAAPFRQLKGQNFAETFPFRQLKGRILQTWLPSDR